MKKLDALFVHPNAAKKIYQELSNNYSAIEPPIWACLLAKHCLVQGCSAEILDCEAERINHTQAVEAIKTANPRLVVFVVYGQQPSASTQNMTGATELAKLLKKTYPEYKVMFVGGHIAALPFETLSLEYIDFICQNEGVYTISSLLKTNLKNHLSEVLGLGWKDDGGIPKLNLPSSIVSQNDLEKDLPGLAWELIDIKKYRTANWHTNFDQFDSSPFASLYTSLGCIYKCNFCMINIINRTNTRGNISAADSAVFRYWQPEFIIKQFDQIAELGIKNVKIADEMYVLKPKHFLELSKLLVERDYGFNIWAYARIDTVKERYLELLKQSGVNWVGLGIESGNQMIRKEVSKGQFKDVNIRDIVSMIQSYDINVTGNYIFGLPNETLDSMQQTLDLAIELDTEYANFYCTMAYPGSPLYIKAKAEGKQLPTTYDGYSQHSYTSLPLAGENLASAEILKFRDEAWTQYFTNPRYLDLVANKFGDGAKQHLEELTKIKLKRQVLGD